MMDLSFGDLLLFTRIAGLGTLSAVAQERNVPVSQVSRGLQRIEAACGAQLVRRTTHGLSLTAEGETVLAHARRVLAEADTLEAELHQSRSQPAGLVRVSMSSVIAQHLMVESLPSLHARHPQLTLDFRVDDALVDMAREGIDIAIRTGDPQTDTLVIRPLGRRERRLYASPDYLARHGPPESVDALSAHRLIVNSQHEHLNRWTFKAKRHLTALGPFQSDNTATLAAMALAGLGIVRLPSVTVQALVREGRLREVLPTQVAPESTPLNAFVLAGRHRLPKIRACLDHWAHWLRDAPPR